MEDEKGNFRGKLFGGFDRRDVISYIEDSAKAYNQLSDERDRLASEKEGLEAAMDELRDDSEAALNALREQKEAELASLRAENDLLRKELEAEKVKTLARKGKELAEVEEVLNNILEKCARVKADLDINLTHTRRRVEGDLDSVMALADDMEVRLSRIQDEIRFARERLK